MQKTFSFKGLALNSDNLLVADGECMELINLRYRDGCLTPIPAVLNETELESGYGNVYWHPAAEMFLAIELCDEKPVHFYDKNLNIVKNGDDSDDLMLFPQLKGVERIEFVGNIVSCITDSTIYYLIFDSGNYRWLGERPSVPELTFSVDSIVYSVTTDESYLLAPSLDGSDDMLYWKNVSMGFFDECLAALHSKGYYVDRALFRFAFRLFDGSYLYHSPIYYVDDDNSIDGITRDEGNFVAETVDAGSGTSVSSSRYRMKVQGFMPSFHFSNIELGAWENIIVAIDVFTTGSIYGHKIANTDDDWKYRDGIYYSNDRGFERYVVKSNEDMYADIANASLFYKIAEYNIQGVLVDSVKDVSLSSLALCDSLPDDDGSLVTRSAAYSYSFNGRLHLAGVRETLFKGYGGQDFLPAAMETVYADYAVVTTRIKTSMGISVVKKEYNGTFALGCDGAYYITPYIMYPDSRALDTTFIIKIAGVIYKKTFSLKQHKALNLAVYLHCFGSGLSVSLVGELQNGTVPGIRSNEDLIAFFSYIPGEYEIVYKAGDGWYYGDEKLVFRTANYSLISSLNPVDGDRLTVVLETGDSTENFLYIDNIEIDDSWDKLTAVESVAEVNPCEIRGNVLKVSAVDNPFRFPANNTYSPSLNDIVAVASNNVALSQGQFGQHPLYIFCKDGIWALNNDSSGGMAYATAHPLSQEVCINAASLCGIETGVAFVSSRGVMLLQGAGIVCISAALDSEELPLTFIKKNSVASKIAMLSYNEPAVSRITFKKYIEKAVIGYLASEKELWISNFMYDYSYVYSLETGFWCKVNNSYTCFINRYPHLLVNIFLDDKSSIAIVHKDYAKGYAPVLLITRPQLWGTKLYKRITQFMLHASIKATTENAGYEYGGLGCYILCSNDGVNFKLLTGAERGKNFNDIVLPFFPQQSYKYYAIALSGTMALESKIAGVELALECVWNNRLR